MTYTEIKNKRDLHIASGKDFLTTATALMHAYADDWNDDRNEEWLGLVHNAEIQLAKAMALDELIAEHKEV